MPLMPQQSLLDHQGEPQLGRFQSAVTQLSWRKLSPRWRRSAWWRLFHRKHWHYLALAHSDWFCALAIVDIGWANTAFAYVMDRRTGQLLADYSRDGIPGYSAKLSEQLETGLHCQFQFFSERIVLSHDAASNQFLLNLDLPGFALQAQIQRGDQPLSLLAVAEVAGGSVHATQKSAGMPAQATLSVAGRHYQAEQVVASMDHSHGFLARDTSWRWASAHDLHLGFNLQAGYLAHHENALWLDQQLYPLAEAEFDYDKANPRRDWLIRTSDGLVDLKFVVEGMRAENKNLIVAQSHYVQPVGRFYGEIRPATGLPAVQIDGLPGVTEDHFSRW